MTSRNREEVLSVNSMQALESRCRKKAAHFRNLGNVEAANELHAAANSMRQAILLGEMLLTGRDQARARVRELTTELSETKREMNLIIRKYQARMDGPSNVHK